MVKIEQIAVISSEIIKPSSPNVNQNQPFYLPLFSQLTPATYSPIIFFYPTSAIDATSNSSINNGSTKLKQSLSETLNIYYPYSGRTADNMFIHRFNEGVPFLVVKVTGKTRLSDFLKNPEIESLNLFLPSQPFTKEVDIDLPLVKVQVTVFSCGGIAIALVASHKLVDGITASSFVNSWAAIARGVINEVIYPNYNEGSLIFPPKNPFPNELLSFMESLWFTEANYVTKRFVFDAKSIASIRDMAKGESRNDDQNQIKISRIEALTCFIWKSCMAASRSVTGSPKPSILVEAVNLRTRTSPPMTKWSLGDIFWWANVVADPSETQKELYELAKMLHEAIDAYDKEYMQTLQGEEGFETMAEYCNQLQGLFSMEDPDIFAFTSWCYLGMNKLDFGYGEPYWVGILGKVGHAFRNLTVLVETRDGKGIEAWITLDSERMAFLENYSEFLAFASPNPRNSSL